MFSKKLREKREEKRLTTYQLSEKVGVSQPYIVQLENGYKEPPSGNVLSRLADVLGCTTDYLLGREK